MTPEWKKLMQINYAFNFRMSDSMKEEYLNPGINPFDNYRNKLLSEFLPTWEMDQAKYDKLFQSEMFFAADCLIDDIDPIKYFTQLKILDLSYNTLSNSELLVVFHGLEILYLEKCGIGSLNFLETLTKIRELWLRNNKINNLNGIENLKELKFLDLGMNNIEDLTPIASLSFLERLQLDNNLIKKVDELVKLPIKVLDLSNNQIETLDFIYKMKQLTFLNLKGNSTMKEQIDRNKMRSDLEIVLDN